MSKWRKTNCRYMKSFVIITKIYKAPWKPNCTVLKEQGMHRTVRHTQQSKYVLMFLYFLEPQLRAEVPAPAALTCWLRCRVQRNNVEVVESMCIKEPSDPKFFVVQAWALHLNVKNWTKVEETTCNQAAPGKKLSVFISFLALSARWSKAVILTGLERWLRC